MSDQGSNINVICFESDAFKAMVSEVTNQMKEELFGGMNPWIREKEAVKLLNVSRNTFYSYRETGKIDHRRLENSKVILYRRQSILDFIENSPK